MPWVRIDQWAVLTGGFAAILWVNWYFFLARRSTGSAVALASGVQESVVRVSGGYTPAEIHVKAGRPVRLVFDRQETNPCSEELVFPEFKIRQFLPAHQRTAIEFTPTTRGSHPFTCGMGMLRGTVIVE